MLPFSNRIGEKNTVGYFYGTSIYPCVSVKGIKKIKITTVKMDVNSTAYPFVLYGTNTYRKLETALKTYSPPNGTYNDIFDVSAYDYIACNINNGGYFEFEIIE